MGGGGGAAVGEQGGRATLSTGLEIHLDVPQVMLVPQPQDTVLCTGCSGHVLLGHKPGSRLGSGLGEQSAGTSLTLEAEKLTNY